jgi:hypothetical protein
VGIVADGCGGVRGDQSDADCGDSDIVADLGEGVFSADVQVLNFQPIVVEKSLYWNSGTEIWAAGTGVVATPLPPP